MAEITRYPYSVELPLSRGYISIIGWLAAQAITEYDHESCLLEGRPYITYWFARQQDAVIFGLRWS